MLLPLNNFHDSNTDKFSNIGISDRLSGKEIMKALVFHKLRDVKVEKVKDPEIKDSRDAILRVTSTAICGSDLHIYNGMIPQAKNMILGHEFMGIVEEVGSDVKNLKKGDRVVVPFPISCGHCWFCDHEYPAHCENSNPRYGPEGGLLEQKGAGLFGYTDLYGGYDGGQAEYARVPYADYGPRKILNDLPDEKALFLSDIFPTGWAGIDWANLTGGETVAVFGCGPVGLMAQKAAWIKGAGRVIAIDILPYRLKKAKETANAEVIDASTTDPVEAIRELTHGRGADVCVDAVGMETDRSIMDKVKATLKVEKGAINTLKNRFSAVRRGGTVSVLGVYSTSYDKFPLGQIFDKGITIKCGQCPVHNYIDPLMDLVNENKIILDDIVTHILPLDQAEHAYDLFNKKEDDCVKVILKP